MVLLMRFGWCKKSRKDLVLGCDTQFSDEKNICAIYYNSLSMFLLRKEQPY